MYLSVLCLSLYSDYNIIKPCILSYAKNKKAFRGTPFIIYGLFRKLFFGNNVEFNSCFYVFVKFHNSFVSTQFFDVFKNNVFTIDFKSFV